MRGSHSDQQAFFFLGKDTAYRQNHPLAPRGNLAPILVALAFGPYGLSGIWIRVLLNNSDADTTSAGNRSHLRF